MYIFYYNSFSSAYYGNRVYVENIIQKNINLKNITKLLESRIPNDYTKLYFYLIENKNIPKIYFKTKLEPIKSETKNLSINPDNVYEFIFKRPFMKNKKTEKQVEKLIDPKNLLHAWVERNIDINNFSLVVIVEDTRSGLYG